MNTKRYLPGCLVLFLPFFFLAACIPQTPQPAAGYVDLSALQPIEPVQQEITPLRVAVASVVSPKGTIQSYEPLLAYFETYFNRPIELVQRRTYLETNELIAEGKVDLDKLHRAAADTASFRGVVALQDAVDSLLLDDDTKRAYLTMANTVDQLFKAILLDPAANQFDMDRKALVVIADEIRSLIPPADITEVMGAVEDLLDDSIVPTKAGYVIHEPTSGGAYLDLSKIDFKALKKQFETSRKHIEAEKLRGNINAKLLRMVRLNRSRINYYQKFQELIEEYNSGPKNVDAFFTELISFAQSLTQEEKRGIAENLNEEELTLFDLLTKPEPNLTRKERDEVKAVARELYDTLKAERLVLDWRKRPHTRAAVQLQIETILDRLPDSSDRNLYNQKCQLVYQHIYDSYYGAGKSIYAPMVG